MAASDPAVPPGAQRPRGRRRGRLRFVAAVAAALIAGNALILVAFVTARVLAPPPNLSALAGIDHARVVADRLWRGDAPSAIGYASLAEHGVRTVVDLRAERDVVVPSERLAALGITRVHVPIRDGQTPTPADVRRFLEVVEASDGVVYVHCGAGVGRTGAMAAAYLVQRGKASPLEALRRNLAVGPPSLEQIVFAAALDRGDVEQPPPPVSLVSRLFDAPRRIWSNIRAAT